MNLKNEYLKRIEIIKSKQETRLKEIELLQIENRENEIKLEEKIENYENIINNKTLSLEIENYEIFDLKKKIIPISKIENFIPQNIDYLLKISNSEHKFNKEIEQLILKEKENKRETIIGEIKILQDFKIKNDILIKNDDNYITKIRVIDEKIKNNNVILNRTIKQYELSLGDKFINRKNKLLFLEKEYHKINGNRIKNNNLQEKIKNQEIENRLFKKQIEKKGEIELDKLNQYIKSQKIYIKNELSTERKKEYFKNIKNRNEEYLEKINKNKLKLEESNKKLISLKEELSNNQTMNTNYTDKIQKMPKNIETKIKDLKSEIEEFKYDKISISLEKKINLDLLEKNKIFYEGERNKLDENFKNLNSNLYETEIELRDNFMLEINTLKINHTLQISNNKNNW